MEMSIWKIGMTTRSNVKGAHNKSQVIEEPYVVKITSTVLKERGNEQLFPRL